jgi:tRNA A37 threonylcarbamoyladenosine synthetase subunit TsaC/SUA5/YrdC
LRSLLRAVGVPVLSTSANLSGEAPCRDVSQVRATFGAALDLVVESDATPGALPSTLVDATGWPLRVVRDGAFDMRRILAEVAP